ncbi:unnamed protein product [Nezara viridula]|uniref:Uncharacterized protein n=1 Tax=Nezara viridula TaxID=85310 RepID=A0A9P0MMU6_NEZVI|nr:unnamed protein product [Nezara viridula]
MKPKPRGSATSKKKAYYLANAMQFAVSFLKVGGNTSGILPKIDNEMTSLSPEAPITSYTPHINVSEEVLSESAVDQQYGSVSPQPSVSTPRRELLGSQRCSLSPSDPQGQHGKSNQKKTKQQTYKMKLTRPFWNTLPSRRKNFFH